MNRQERQERQEEIFDFALAPWRPLALGSLEILLLLLGLLAVDSLERSLIYPGIPDGLLFFFSFSFQ
ncbi:hypothetical protein WMF37_03500 [Sorangium sp. So ce291]|uniref:hypothetical protein n=1 Tax=Sorangium sp. So ce291 TaxID=3133294 RepID=UPI003F60CB30